MSTPESDGVRRPRQGAVEWWVQLLDALAITAILVAVIVLVSGGFALPLRPFRVSSHSVLRPLMLAAVLLTLRHVLAPAPAVHRRVVDWLRALPVDATASIVATALASRVAVLLTAYAAVLTIGLSPRYGFMLSTNPLFNLPAKFDAGWYGSIALDGYEFAGGFDTQQNIAFFPAYPIVLRTLGYVAGAFEPGVSRDQRMARALWAGVLFSILAFTWAATYFARLARETIGHDDASAAVALLAAYPFAVFYSAPYTESLFLLGSIAAFYHYRKREWLRAGLWGALVGLTRPNGCFISVVLVCVTVEQLWRASSLQRREYPFGPAIVAAAAPVAGMLAYSAYIRHLTGFWFGWARVHSAWGRSFLGLSPLGRVGEWVENGLLMQVAADVPIDALNALALTFAVAMLWPIFRRVGLAACVFVLVNIVPPMLTGSVLSMGRFTSTLFPIFLALAAVLPRPFVVPVATMFAAGQGLAAALFFTWRPLF